MKKLNDGNKEIITSGVIENNKEYELAYHDKMLSNLQNLDEKISYTKNAIEECNNKAFKYRKLSNFFKEFARKSSMVAMAFLVIFLGLVTYTDAMGLIYFFTFLTGLSVSSIMLGAVLDVVMNKNAKNNMYKACYYYNLYNSYEKEEEQKPIIMETYEKEIENNFESDLNEEINNKIEIKGQSRVRKK